MSRRSSNACETLQETLANRLEEEPEGELCRLIAPDGAAQKVTVQTLLGRAMAFAERFGAPWPQRRLVAVCLYHNIDLHAAFLGALWAGHIPTMLAPPSPRMEGGKYAASFCQMVQHLKPASVVVDSATMAKLSEFHLEPLPGCELVNPADVPQQAHVAPWKASPDDVAVIQHSSGTTGLQKGIALSHRAILDHNEAYARTLNLNRDDRIASWLPLYHDMGFIACFLLPVLCGIPFVEMSPFDWVLRPAMLLEQIHQHRATLCWLPNFAYTFLAHNVRPSELPSDLNLGSIRAWINCSEPVFHSSHLAFLKRFGDYGVRMEQFTASYAMAENVFAVTQSLPGRYKLVLTERKAFNVEKKIAPSNDPDSLVFVSNGRPVQGTQLAVLDDGENQLPEDHVGELALHGGYLFAGYFGRRDLTAKAMTADGWYKTGDLGFIHDGEVYVTGRKKDLIIIQGRNFYPTDIESIGNQVPGVTPGRVVAFGLLDEQLGTEQLVILAEAEEGDPAGQRHIALQIRQRIAQELDCTPADVRIVPPRWLIKSTSGKLARDDNRKKYSQTFLQSKETQP